MKFLTLILFVFLGHTALSQELALEPYELGKAKKLAKETNKPIVVFGNGERYSYFIKKAILTNNDILKELNENYIFSTATLPSGVRFRFYSSQGKVMYEYTGNISSADLLTQLRNINHFPEIFDGKLSRRMFRTKPNEIEGLMDTLYTALGSFASRKHLVYHIYYKNNIRDSVYIKYVNFLLPDIHKNILYKFLRQHNLDDIANEGLRDKIGYYFYRELGDKWADGGTRIAYVDEQLKQSGSFNNAQSLLMLRVLHAIESDNIGSIPPDKLLGVLYQFLSYKSESNFDALISESIKYLVINVDDIIDFNELVNTYTKLAEFSDNPKEHDLNSLLWFKVGENDKAIASLVKARELAHFQNIKFEPTLPLVKEYIKQLNTNN